MAYNKTVWINGTAPPINAENLNKIEQGIEDAHAVVPAVDGTVGQVLTKTSSGTEWSDAGNPTDTQVAEAVTDWLDENITEIPATAPIVDASLTVQGAAADAKKTGDEISELKSQIAQSTGMSTDFKVALENLLSHVGFSGDDPTGRTYLEALHTAMYPPANLTRIEAVYSGGDVYDTDSLDSLRNNLVVTAYYDNNTSEVVTSYTLSGTLTEGTSTITVSYGGKETTFNVTVIHAIDVYHDFLNDGSTWYLDQRAGSITSDGDTKLVATISQANSWNLVAKRNSLKKKLSDVSGKTGLLKWKATYENFTGGNGLTICVALVSSASTSSAGRQKYYSVPSHTENGTYSDEFTFDLTEFTGGSGGGTSSYICLWIYFVGNVDAVLTMEDIEFYALNE